MRYCPLPLLPSGFERVLPPCPSPAELASRSPGDALVSTDVSFCLSSITVTRLVAHRTPRDGFPITGLLVTRASVIGTPLRAVTHPWSLASAQSELDLCPVFTTLLCSACPRPGLVLLLCLLVCRPHVSGKPSVCLSESRRLSPVSEAFASA
jgi:hypothetical protein